MFHTMSEEKLFSTLKSSPRGLSDKEANQRLKNGKNEMNDQNKNGIFLMYLSQFKDLMVLLLIGAAVISAITAYVNGSSDGLVDTFIIVFIIFLNATVGFIQQFKADKALDKLKKLSVSKAKVLRDGKVVSIDSSLLVVGDIVVLEEGDMVPADLRLISCSGLMTDESALTGESKRASKELKLTQKNTPLGDRKNICYSSTFVVKGNGRGVVVATGMNTEIGKIAKLISGKEDLSPLQKQLNNLGKIISLTVIFVAALIFFVNLFFSVNLLQNFMSAVAIAVAAVPEGMPAVVTIIMAMGMQKMIRFGAVVRKLHVVEALGSCSVICSDKTGTLTQNRMTVVSAQFFSNAEEKALQCIEVCNSINRTKEGFLGDPTEVALIEYASKKREAKIRTPQKVLPFDSDRKMMSVFFEGNTFSKGAPEEILKRCKYIYDGELRELTSADVNKIRKTYESMSLDALRVIAFAYKTGEFCEKDLVFLGQVGMMDPPKMEALEAVKSTKRAGIKTVMITGDHKNTAFAIAKNLDIANNIDEVITGEELDHISDETLNKKIKTYSVFARVSPQHKLRIVEALKKRGEVVAMTGDGINDAPAIKRADIGIAMGSGTDVTKNASDMIITDDNFATIVVAVKEGRRIFSNIKKTVKFFLSTNVAEVFCVFLISVFFRAVNFLTSSQLLWINLITDTFPVLAMGVERAEKNVMERPPKSATKSMFSASTVASIIYYGAIQTAIVLVCFFGALRLSDNATASTMAFFTLSFVELIHAFNIRSEQSIFRKDFFSNKVLISTTLFAVVLNVCMGYIPFVARAFSIVPLSINEWLIVFALSLSIIPFGEILKSVLFAKKSRKKGALAPL